MISVLLLITKLPSVVIKATVLPLFLNIRDVCIVNSHNECYGMSEIIVLLWKTDKYFIATY